MFALDPITLLAIASLALNADFGRADNPKYWNDIVVNPSECPEGSEWIEWRNSFFTGSTRVDNPYDEWISERGVPGVHDAIGVPLKLEKGAGNNDTALMSASEWKAPLFAKIDIQSTGAPGIPSTFNFRKDGVTDWKEINFIIATIETDNGKLKNFVSTPLWMPAEDGSLRKLKTMGSDKEVEVVLAEGTHFATDISKRKDDFVGQQSEATFDQNWGITWKDFQPAKGYHTYATKWLPDKIEWYAGEKNKASLRITLNKKTTDDKSFPKGPFPIRLGPWEAAGDWAGEVNWQKYPEPTMKVSLIEVKGCRVINKAFDKKMDKQSEVWKR